MHNIIRCYVWLLMYIFHGSNYKVEMNTLFYKKKKEDYICYGDRKWQKKDWS